MFSFLSKKFSSLVNNLSGNATLTEKNIADALQSIKDALLEADVPYDVVEQFAKEVHDDALGNKVLSSVKPGEQFMGIVHSRLKTFLGGATPQEFTFKTPSVTMVMGLQGSGKTTTISKLSRYLLKQAHNKQHRVLVGSVDFYRPAAVDQLEVLARTVGVSFYRAQNTDPVQAANEIIAHARQAGCEYVLLDTAGRLHVDNTMLQELQEIDTSVQPDHKILVLDAMTGQESLNVAKAFDQSVGFHGAILTKMDSDARGGAAFAFRYALDKPIFFVGTGEKPDEFQAFKPDRMASKILGMGDLATLAEKADEKIKQSEQEAAYKSMMSGTMTLNDFAKQMSMVGRLGSLSSVMKYMPGMANLNLTPEMIEKGEKEMKRFKAIISSMTPKERSYHKILDGSRKKRVAKGAGVAVAEVNQVLARFEQSQQFAKLLKKSGPFKNMFNR